MKIAQYFVTMILTIYGIIKATNWQKSNFTQKFFAILALFLAGLVLYNASTDYLSTSLINNSLEYLTKNRASLNCNLYIDSFKNDSITYHLELTNIHSIPAKNILYKMNANREWQFENQNINSVIGQNDIVNLYPISNNLKPTKIDELGFSIDIFLFFNSIWENDTLNCREKFTFIIPKHQVKIGKFNPISKITDKIYSPAQLDSIALEYQLKRDNGSITFSWFDNKLNDSINYFILKDSVALLYRKKQNDIIFQKLFNSGEVLTLSKTLIPRNVHIITINWIKDNYTLYVEGDSATNIYRQKVLDFPSKN